MNEDTSGNVASLQEEIRKLKLLLSEARGTVDIKFQILCTPVSVPATVMNQPRNSGTLLQFHHFRCL